MNAPEPQLLISEKGMKSLEEVRALMRGERPANAMTAGDGHLAANAVTPPSVDNAADPCDEILAAGETSIAHIDQLIEELQAARNYLKAEGERVHRLNTRYVHLAHTASASAKVIFESMSKWRSPEREPVGVAPSPIRLGPAPTLNRIQNEELQPEPCDPEA